MVQVFGFGHSVTYGFWDKEGGWIQRLRKYLDERALEEQDEELVSDVYNLGVSGEDSGDLLERFEAEFEARAWEESDQVILVQIGANDIQFLKEQQEIRVSEDDYRRNIRELLDTAEDLADEVLVISDFYISIEGEIPYAPEKKVSDERLENYMSIQKQVCQKKNVSHIDIRDEFKPGKAKEMLEDGLHPNSDGHERIFEIVRERLEKEGIIR
ncbi:MAG: acyl-CoA thioesterase-1 [Candidatus Nanohaloarchaea archaeon]|jgi:acyl-CoA thioesterase-1